MHAISFSRPRFVSDEVASGAANLIGAFVPEEGKMLVAERRGETFMRFEGAPLISGGSCLNQFMEPHISGVVQPTQDAIVHLRGPQLHVELLANDDNETLSKHYAIEP